MGAVKIAQTDVYNPRCQRLTVVGGARDRIGQRCEGLIAQPDQTIAVCSICHQFIHWPPSTL